MNMIPTQPTATGIDYPEAAFPRSGVWISMKMLLELTNNLENIRRLRFRCILDGPGSTAEIDEDLLYITVDEYGVHLSLQCSAEGELAPCFLEGAL